MPLGSAKPRWVDPVKNRPAKESTMNTRGDFGEFTTLMKKVVSKPESPLKTEEEKLAQNRPSR
jgi:hypothetical protein